jgi:hypothetical protein
MTIKKTFTTLLLLAFIVPQVTFAAWWNPFSWRLFSWLRSEPKTIVQELSSATTTDDSITVKSSDTKSDSPTTGSEVQETKTIHQSAPTPSPVQTLPKTQVINLPNGAVVEVDASGNILRYIKDVPQVQPPVQADPQQTQTSTHQNTSLSISLGTVTTNTASVRIRWNTNIPSDSKIFLTLDNGSIQVVPSASGYSTQHFVDMSNLKSNTQYSYTIEAINSLQVQKISNMFSMPVGRSCTLAFRTTEIDQNGNKIRGMLSWSYDGLEEGKIERSQAWGGTKFPDVINGTHIEFLNDPLATYRFNIAISNATTTIPSSYWQYFKLSFPDGTKCYAVAE